MDILMKHRSFLYMDTFLRLLRNSKDKLKIKYITNQQITIRVDKNFRD